MEPRRRVKRPDELDHIRKAAKLTDECFTFITKELAAGVWESEIAWSIESFIRTRGGTLAFPPIAAFGANSSMPHYQYTNEKSLEAGQPVLLDMGARVDGYCADMTRMVYFGTSDEDFRRAYDAVRDAQEKSLEYLGSAHPPKGAEADKKARGILTNYGFTEYPHSLGHALGLDIHERPRLTKFRDDTLEPGMVVTVEPAVYLAGKFGIRIEDTVLITENGIEILTKTDKNIITLPVG
jgi:Xaa-Pro aminopeptidase